MKTGDHNEKLTRETFKENRPDCRTRVASVIGGRTMRPAPGRRKIRKFKKPKRQKRKGPKIAGAKRASAATLFRAMFSSLFVITKNWEEGKIKTARLYDNASENSSRATFGADVQFNNSYAEFSSACSSDVCVRVSNSS